MGSSDFPFSRPTPRSRRKESSDLRSREHFGFIDRSATEARADTKSSKRGGLW